MIAATSQAAVKRLRSRNATHYTADTMPTVTVLHRTRSGGTMSTTGRLFAETSREIAVMVRSSPVVIAVRDIETRTYVGGNGLPTFDGLVRATFGTAR